MALEKDYKMLKSANIMLLLTELRQQKRWRKADQATKTSSEKLLNKLKVL